MDDGVMDALMNETGKGGGRERMEQAANCRQHMDNR